ncbi:D-alanine aminotransferase [Posidoniimonas corsicana]|uniref:branched-chain-amino-acid transaminase n=1 Tax=Posidoniimonas corsicana TaxID=1938618 RepID=A0A5C5VK15_9BACT|nr:aminotransferase class IV [Posidoniimonas corsicana]TWT38280.1 D-alanine aminotransferase [Posidoniimonas corsicana]
MPPAYLNGDWIDDAQLSVPVADAGFAMGVTVTERLRTFGPLPFRQPEHIQRLRRSLEIVGLPADEIATELDSVVTEYAARIASLRTAGDDWAIVVFATPGVGGVPTRCVHGFPLPFAQWADQYQTGVSLRVSDHRQTPASCWPPELKCRSRMHYYLADQQARAAEPGARALLLDQDGCVGEASTANVVIYREEEGVVSPRIEKILPGVSVAVVRELADQLGVPFTERDMTVEEFLSADEAWLSSTSVCLLPVVRCDGQAVGTGEPGPQFERFLAAWSDLVGVDIAAQAMAHSPTK